MLDSQSGLDLPLENQSNNSHTQATVSEQAKDTPEMEHVVTAASEQVPATDSMQQSPCGSSVQVRFGQGFFPSF